MKLKTLTLTPTQIDTLHHQMQAYPLRQIDHAHFQAKLDHGTITAYKSGKVDFAGDDALLYAQQFEKAEISQAGSDEVGTGDYFGPVVVCAAYVEEKQLAALKEINIMDSKQISDAQIKVIAPKIMKLLTYSVLILDNEKYNEVHKKLNMNAIKAQLHQKAYQHLREKLGGKLPDLVIVDEFTPASNYYKYLNDDYGINHITFETKAEDKYISVACAAIIARYTFLQALTQLSEHYEINFPKGAGAQVDQFGIRFVNKYSLKELNRVAKVHFKNTQRIKESINPK